MLKNKKRTKGSLMMVAIVLVIAIAGAFAYLTDHDSKVNEFTVGDVDIQLIEKFDTDHSGEIEEDEIFKGNTLNPSTDNMMPEETIIKTPWTKNIGSNDAYIFMTVSIPKQELKINKFDDEDGLIVVEEETELFTVNNVDEDHWMLIETAEDAEGYVNYLYVYVEDGKMKKLAPDAETEELFQSVTFANLAYGSADGISTKNFKFDIPVHSYAIQSSGIDDDLTPIRVWDIFCRSSLTSNKFVETTTATE